MKTGKRKRVQTRGGQMLEDGTVVPSTGKRSRNSSKKQQQLQERLRKRQEEEEVRRSKLLKVRTGLCSPLLSLFLELPPPLPLTGQQKKDNAADKKMNE